MNGNERPLYDYSSAAELDRASIALGFSETQLMGQAALAFLNALASEFAAARRVLFLCGSGNNGGDGYALAWQWISARAMLGAAAGSKREALLLAAGTPRSAAANLYADRLRTIDDPMLTAASVELKWIEPAALPDLALDDRDLVVEALLGAGQKAPLRETVAGILAWLCARRRQTRAPALVALDCPAGLFEELATEFGDAAPLPDRILGAGAGKLAVHLHAQLRANARIEDVPIGFQWSAPQATRLQADAGHRRWFARRPLDHKYSAGHGWLFAGSPGMEGAALLAAGAFAAAGGGILHGWSTAASDFAVFSAAAPATLWAPLDALQGRLPGVIAVGPGLAPADVDRAAVAVARCLKETVAETPPWLILDADATRLALSSTAILEEAARSRTLITPHGGEWRRLGAPPIDCVAALRRARDWHQQNLRCWALVKGAVSVLFSPDGAIYLLGEPQANLATAGSGDVLVGLLLALLSRTDREGAAPQWVAAALALLASAAQGVNPAAGDFPEGIRRQLAGERE